MTDTPSSVISGVPYAVTTAGEQPPTGLDAFLGETVFTIDMAGRPYVVRGTGDALDGRVRVHEKSTVAGKDVRVWHVVQSGQDFTAEHVAAF
jgi:hypothetical protein